MQDNKRNTSVTMQDIADRLSISKVTVSKALRGHPDISERTRDKVEKMAVDLGYVPNHFARSLGAKRSRTIGVIVPKIAHHFFSTVIESIYETAYKNDYDVILTVSQENEVNEAQHIKTLISMKVDGILVSVTEKTISNEAFQIVRSKNIPLVFFDRKLDGLGFPSVTTDDIRGGEMATELLVKNGNRKMAFIGGYDHTNIGHDRLIGFKNILDKNKIPLRKDWVIESGFSEKDGYDGFEKIIESGEIPDAVFAITYPVALGVYASAINHNISIPNDMNMVCIGGIGYQRFVSPSISYVKQPAKRLGQRAAELLFEELNGNAIGSKNIKLPPEIVTEEFKN